tara:strand:- start:855 stop:1898 length:1044 start_codon:yes stop_codon:yes gene_type:complete
MADDEPTPEETPETPEASSTEAEGAPNEESNTETSSVATGVVYKADGSRHEAEAQIAVKVCDFRNPVFLTEVELRQIRTHNESFIHYLGARLSLFLNMEVGLKMTQLHTIPYDKFTEAIPNPAYISLFKIEELTGVGILTINPHLSMTLINRMLGGQGASIKEDRPLTELEMILMEDLVHIMMNEWCNQWKEIQELHTSLIGRESNGRFLQTAPHDAIMLVLDIEATLGECTELIQIGIPYYMIEPIIRSLQAEGNKYSTVGSVTKQPQWTSSYSNIDVPVFAEWDGFSISIKDLLKLRPGDTVELREGIMQNTIVRLENISQFKAEVGLNDNQVAVKIKEKIKTED